MKDKGQGAELRLEVRSGFLGVLVDGREDGNELAGFVQQGGHL